MLVASWNVNSLRVRLEHVQRWLEQSPVDVLALQETKVKDENFPADAFAELGYESHCNGEAGYNGVALVSRRPLHDVVTELDGFEDTQRRVLAATIDGVRIVNLYVPNGQRVGSEKYTYKLAWMDALKGQLAGELARHPRCVVVGDFNVAPEDRDVHDPELWEGKVLCSGPEREALQRIMQIGLVDSFRLFDQPEGSFSWWDYRAGSFRRNRGLRIDLILTSRALADVCGESHIDKTPRGWERPSDHAPVVTQFTVG